MKKLLLICIVSLCLIGCSSSGPEITSVSSSDETPFAGQTLLLSVYSLTDNPPMTYTWECSAGTFDEWENSDHLVFWTAPEEPGDQSVTCTVTDEADDREIFTFTIDVQERSIDDTLVEEPVLSILRQKTSRIGGIWVSTEEGDIRYITSGTNELTTWEGAFATMHVGLNSDGSSYTLWGAGQTGTDITMQTPSSEETLSCETCGVSDTINDMVIDVLDPDLLWVGSDTGLHWYSNAGEGQWGEYKSEKTNDLFEGLEFVYAATTTGIYELDPFAASPDPIYTGDSCAVLEVANDDDTITVWHITDSQVCKDGVALPVQPDTVTCSLDKDWNNTVWCGKYWWDETGGSWRNPAGLEGIDISESVVSNEGLVYLMTTSGTLLRW